MAPYEMLSASTLGVQLRLASHVGAIPANVGLVHWAEPGAK